jgi:hypothetical protein
MRERHDVARAEETVEAVRAQLDALEAEFKRELAAQGEKIDAQAEPLETLVARPKKTQVKVSLVALAWAPRSG